MERRNKKTKSVGNGEGSLYYSDTLQCWVFQYVVDGKRKTLKQKKNEKVKDFKARVTKTKNDINNNTYIDNTDISIYNIIYDYIKNKHDTGITSDRTYIRDRETLKLLEKFCSDFIYRPIQKVTIANIKKSLPNFTEFEYYNKSEKKITKTYSQTCIDKTFRLLKKAFQIAVSERIIIYNIMENENIKKPKSKKEKEPVRALTVDEELELVKILRNSNHKYKNIVLLALFTGARIGEVLAITKNNIDLTNNTLAIEKTLTRDINDKVILSNKTKTKNGKREIFLTNNAKDILRDVLKSKITNMHNLIFYDYGRNTFVTPYSINSFLRRLNEKHKICDHIHTHMLRHTFATRCIEAGMSAKVLQKNLGHSKIDITLNIYTDVFEKFNKNENEKYNLYMEKLQSL